MAYYGLFPPMYTVDRLRSWTLRIHSVFCHSFNTHPHRQGHLESPRLTILKYPVKVTNVVIRLTCHRMWEVTPPIPLDHLTILNAQERNSQSQPGFPGHACRGPVIFLGTLHNVFPALASFYHRASWHLVDPRKHGNIKKKIRFHTYLATKRMVLRSFFN